MRTAKKVVGSKIKRVIATTLLATTLATSISLSVPANTITVQAQASEQGHTKKVSMQRKHMVRANTPVAQYESQGYSMALSLMQEILRGNKSTIVLDAKDKTVVWGYDRDLAAIQGNAIEHLNYTYFKHYNLNDIEKGGGLTYKYKDPSGLNESYAVITINVSQAKKLYKKNQQIEDKLASIIKACGITNNTTEYEAVRQINKWIATNIEYEYGAGATNEGNNSYQLALTYGSTRCGGYAKLFQVLCDYVGIDSYLIESDSQNHAWNAVSIDNVMYHIDVCWDACWKNTNIEKWFLLSESEMLKDHGKITYDQRNSKLGTKRVPVTFHSINYNLNGGKNNELNPTHYVLTDGKLVSSKFRAPTKKGYIFKGWYSNGKKITTLK